MRTPLHLIILISSYAGAKPPFYNPSDTARAYAEQLERDGLLCRVDLEWGVTPKGELVVKQMLGLPVPTELDLAQHKFRQACRDRKIARGEAEIAANYLKDADTAVRQAAKTVFQLRCVTKGKS